MQLLSPLISYSFSKPQIFPSDNKHDCNTSFLHFHIQKMPSHKSGKHTHKQPFASPDPDGNSTTDSCIYQSKSVYVFCLLFAESDCHTAHRMIHLHFVLNLRCSNDSFGKRTLHCLVIIPILFQSVYIQRLSCGMPLSPFSAHLS